MTERLTTEYRARVYNDDHGYFVEVRDDRDGLGLCEVAYSDGEKDSKETAVVMSWPHAVEVAHAILQCAKSRERIILNEPSPSTVTVPE